MSTLYCRASDIVTANATLALTAGTADANYPLTNINDSNAATVFKSTGTNATIQATFGSPQTLQGLAIVNHNLTGATVTVTNGAGFNQSFAIPAKPEDGLTLDPWMDYRSLANTSSTVWTVTITGAATVVAIGELVLIATLRSIEMLIGTGGAVQDAESHQAIVLQTDYGVRLRYGFGVRQRRWVFNVFPTAANTFRADILSLQRDARGPLKNFLFIFDSTVNDAVYVDLTVVEHVFQRGPLLAQSIIQLQLTEQQKGLAL